MLGKYRVACLTTATLVALACGGSDNSVGPNGKNGTLSLYLTDAPFPFDSVKNVDVFVLRIDAKKEDADSATADKNVDEPASGGWITVATPNKAIDLLTLRDGKTESLGDKPLEKGDYRSFRLILDVDKSSVTLKDGTKLTGVSDPGIKFPSAGHSGLKINLDKAVTIDSGSTKLLIDFDVGSSFVMRGNSLARNGLLFKPVIHGSMMEP
jgi:hypothetical protein